MPKMSYTDAKIHAAQDLIHALQNPAPANPLVALVNLHKEKLRYLTEIFEKNSPAVPPRVPIKKAYPDKIQQVNQEKDPIKKSYQLERPINHSEPLRVPIDKLYPEDLKQAKKTIKTFN